MRAVLGSTALAGANLHGYSGLVSGSFGSTLPTRLGRLMLLRNLLEDVLLRQILLLQMRQQRASGS